MAEHPVQKTSRFVRLCRQASGQDLVEFALVLPILLALIFGIVEFSLVIFAHNAIANAAREGARCGSVHGVECADMEQYLRDNWLTGLSAADVTVEATSGDDDTIQVEVGYTYHFLAGPVIMGLGGPGTVPLRAVATMHVE